MPNNHFAIYERDIRMYKNPRPQTNYKAIIKDYLVGFAVIGLILFVLLGWSIALAAPNCSFDYQTGITTCL